MSASRTFETAPASLLAVHARRHPFLVVALTVTRAVLGFALAWPLVSLVRSTYAAHPLGDRVLFEPGALELVDFVARLLGPVAPLLESYALALVALAFVAECFVFGATLSTLQIAHDGPLLARARGALQHGVRFAPGLGAQWLATLALQGVVLSVGALAGGAVAHGLAARSGEPTADRIAVLAVLPFVLVTVILSVVRDVAAATRLVTEAASFSAFVGALRAVLKRPRYLLDYAWRGATGLGVTALVGLAAVRLGGRPGVALFVLTIFHGVALGMRAALRVSWLAAATRRVRASAPPLGL